CCLQFSKCVRLCHLTLPHGLSCLRAAILAPPVLAVVRLAAQMEALSLHPLSSYHRSKQGRSCVELSSNEYGGYTAFSHTVCRWRHSTALAIYYSKSIFVGMKKTHCSIIHFKK